jgi:hypothetical protein
MNPLRHLLVMIGLASTVTASVPDLEPGQCWAYAARTNEKASYLVIRKIETLPKLGDVAHISVYGLRIKNPTSPTGYADQAGHIPISLEALRGSLTAQVKRPIPETNWMEGYSLWREAYEAGKGGVFSKSVSECIGFMEEAINKK